MTVLFQHPHNAPGAAAMRGDTVTQRQLKSAAMRIAAYLGLHLSDDQDTDRPVNTQVPLTSLDRSWPLASRDGSSWGEITLACERTTGSGNTGSGWCRGKVEVLRYNENPTGNAAVLERQWDFRSTGRASAMCTRVRFVEWSRRLARNAGSLTTAVAP